MSVIKGIRYTHRIEQIRKDRQRDRLPGSQMVQTALKEPNGSTNRSRTLSKIDVAVI